MIMREYTFVKMHTTVDLAICTFYYSFMTISREIKHPVVVARYLGFREDSPTPTCTHRSTQTQSNLRGIFIPCGFSLAPPGLGASIP